MIPEREGSQPSEIPEPEAAEASPPAVRIWHPLALLLFRFAFAYLVLYNVPFPLTIIPGAELVGQAYEGIWEPVVARVGTDVFGVKAVNQQNGSGDTTYDYVKCFCFLVAAVAAALLWTGLDRKRKEHARLNEWLRVYVRFSLAAAMLSYGAYKVIKSQFADPGLDALMQPIGDGSPMGLVWNFMGASTPYTVFTGAAEMLGGFLLAVRRTAVLGALVSVGVMSNVVMLNFCYDVPVKLYSVHLLAMAGFLLLPDLKRLADLFVFNRRVESATIKPLFASPGRHRAVLVFRALFVLAIAGLTLYRSLQASRMYGDLMPKPPLHGIWEVNELAVDGVDRPPLLSDASRWRRVIFDYPEFMSIQLMGGADGKSRDYYQLRLNPEKGRMILTKPGDLKSRSVLAYRQPAPGILELEGRLDGKPMRARLQRLDESRIMLVSRGFHWINEYPFNH